MPIGTACFYSTSRLVRLPSGSSFYSTACCSKTVDEVRCVCEHVYEHMRKRVCEHVYERVCEHVCKLVCERVCEHVCELCV